MTDIMTQLRTWSADKDHGRTDFDDLPRGHFSAAKDTGMVRIVEGADDLVAPARSGRGGGVALPVMMSTAKVNHDGDTCNNPRCCPQAGPVDQRTEAQVRYMDNLISWITEKDAELGAKARTWTDGMTGAGNWEAGRGNNISRWIDSLKAKLTELKTAAVAAGASVPVTTQDYAGQPSFANSGNVMHDELPMRNNKSGKPMPQYFLVDIDGTPKFYRIKAGSNPGWWWIDAQASDEFHPVRNVGTKNSILRAIIAAGAQDCMERYGQELGSCGRCHRTLTDADSRSRGIGPECWGKM